jgi:hypothetical protein
MGWGGLSGAWELKAPGAISRELIAFRQRRVASAACVTFAFENPAEAYFPTSTHVNCVRESIPHFGITIMSRGIKVMAMITNKVNEAGRHAPARLRLIRPKKLPV